MVLTWLYRVIAGVLALRIVYQFILIRMKVRHGHPDLLEGLRLFRVPGSHVSFSFFRDIFIGQISNAGDLDRILTHEKVHARQLHTLDVIFSEFFTCVFWFNPLSWWYRNELRNVHEYLADEGALEKGFNIKSYQITLLEHLIGSASLSITNHFNYSRIKNRIAMMNTEKKKKSNIWKGLLILPSSILLLVLFSCAEKTNDQPISGPDKETFYIVEEMPTFNGGDPAVEFRKYISENLRYPKEAVDRKASGRVIVQFDVNSKGKVMDAKVVSGADPALDAEALRVINSSPTWQPGKQHGKKVKVEFTFPINFALQ